MTLKYQSRQHMMFENRGISDPIKLDNSFFDEWVGRIILYFLRLQFCTYVCACCSIFLVACFDCYFVKSFFRFFLLLFLFPNYRQWCNKLHFGPRLLLRLQLKSSLQISGTCLIIQNKRKIGKHLIIRKTIENSNPKNIKENKPLPCVFDVPQELSISNK